MLSPLDLPAEKEHARPAGLCITVVGVHKAKLHATCKVHQSQSTIHTKTSSAQLHGAEQNHPQHPMNGQFVLRSRSESSSQTDAERRASTYSQHSKLQTVYKSTRRAASDGRHPSILRASLQSVSEIFEENKNLKITEQSIELGAPPVGNRKPLRRCPSKGPTDRQPVTSPLLARPPTGWVAYCTQPRPVAGSGLILSGSNSCTSGITTSASAAYLSVSGPRAGTARSSRSARASSSRDRAMHARR
eukprot:scaffold4641_cov117-Isochrysis_galbana.AAC.11